MVEKTYSTSDGTRIIFMKDMTNDNSFVPTGAKKCFLLSMRPFKEEIAVMIYVK